MIGFNGGLIGAARETSDAASVPGVWTPREQLKAKRASLWPEIAGEDPYFSNVSLLLRGNGTNGSTTIVDSSPSPKTVTAYGNAQISTAQSKYGGSSITFDGSGDYLVSASNVDFAFGTADFTIEFWFYPVALPSGNKMLIDMRTSGANAVPTIYTASGVLSYYTNSLNRITGSLLSTGQWYHIAVSRSSTATKMFLNGTQDGSTYVDGVNYVQSAVYVCEYFGGGYASNGYIDDLRITKGVARYTSNFTPPGAL